MVNRTIEHYLRCFAGHKPSSWVSCLPWAEWWYNTTYHASIKTSPFEALYGYPPPAIQHYLPGSSLVQAVDTSLQNRDNLLTQLRHNLLEAQNRMKTYTDRNRTDREFSVGDWVFLRLQPYRQSTIASSRNQKLAPKFYGPFAISERIGKVAYRLNLPPTAKLHPVFHISQLKRKVGDSISVTPNLPPITAQPEFQWTPEKILDHRTDTTASPSRTQWLIQWFGLPLEDATWEYSDEIMARFPLFRA